MTPTSDLWLRVGPFLGFVALTALQGRAGPYSQYWLYALKTVAAGIFFLWGRRRIAELRVQVTWLGVAAGLAIFLLWVGLDPYYPKLSVKGNWNPPADFGPGSPLALAVCIVRVVGMTLVVPLLEEVFYRSFLYRYLISPEFMTVSLRTFNRFAFLVTALIFGFSHAEWLPGVLCGLALQGLALRRGHLGEAVAAHALANLLLGIWVVTRNAWHFW